ncbi:putative Lactosylceramide 4-alpha-galactosyltransferase [Melia azedarach]|uniref:Lactosylceramide 4-alpha-galactosyltransferase n=1 Tax=Melia azedarach TaxID=155640 RepID=A0ACC1WZ68_MELAZ|nr:putative Lactosylceramide 4-alpha-galactosyltransferase [Melia azedarach]
MKMRREFQRMSSYRLLSRAKSVIFSIALFAAIIFIIYEDSVISNDSLHSAAFRAIRISEKLQNKVGGQIKSTITNIPLLSVKEEIVNADRGIGNSLKPPFNVTEEERVAWFRKKLPEFEIFKSDNLTQQFHGRVLDFFSHDCEIQTFMTWISPASYFGRREVLAMETFFKAHPHGCLMILSRTLDSPHGYRILKPLLDRKFKVSAVTPDLSFLFKNTPAEAWYHELKSGNRDPGEIPLAQNLSNLMRLAVLYKYGGIYVDTDFIILKGFKGLKNSIGAQSIDMVSGNWSRLNNAVLIFDMNHPLLFKFIEEFAATFDGNKWGHNGPYLVSRVVQRVENRPGYNFTILPPNSFYPVHWNRIGGLFKMPENQAQSRWVNAKLLQLSRETYGVHLWNKQSNRIAIEERSVMGRIISEHCVICEQIYGS